MKVFFDLKALKSSRIPSLYLPMNSEGSDPVEKYPNRFLFKVECIAFSVVRTERCVFACSFVLWDLYLPIGARSSPTIAARKTRKWVWVRRENVHVAYLSPLRIRFERTVQTNSV